jgi:hypothetical protein
LDAYLLQVKQYYAVGSKGASLDPLTRDALQVRFKFNVPGISSSIARGVTVADIDYIMRHFRGVVEVLRNKAVMFKSGTPRPWGIHTPAAAPFGGPIMFGAAFTECDNSVGKRIGPNSRAAIIIHESVHVINPHSGDAPVHISEFWSNYATQPTRYALNNPSAYASFAAHVHERKNPKPRMA